MLKVPPPSLVAQTGQEEVQIRKAQLAGDKNTIIFYFLFFPYSSFLMQDKILARVKYWKLEVPPVEERPTHDQLYFD